MGATTSKIISTAISTMILLIIIVNVIMPIVEKSKFETDTTYILENDPVIYKLNSDGKLVDKEGNQSDADITKATKIEPMAGAKTLNAIIGMIPLLLGIGSLLLVVNLMTDKR